MEHFHSAGARTYRKSARGRPLRGHPPSLQPLNSPSTKETLVRCLPQKPRSSAVREMGPNFSPIRCHEPRPHTARPRSHLHQQHPTRLHTPLSRQTRSSKASSAHSNCHGRVGPSSSADCVCSWGRAQCGPTTGHHERHAGCPGLRNPSWPSWTTFSWNPDSMPPSLPPPPTSVPPTPQDLPHHPMAPFVLRHRSFDIVHVPRMLMSAFLRQARLMFWTASSVADAVCLFGSRKHHRIFSGESTPQRSSITGRARHPHASEWPDTDHLNGSGGIYGDARPGLISASPRPGRL